MKRMNATTFDNGGKTFDRYTIILENGDVYGANETPTAPNGFGCYAGTTQYLRNKTQFEFCWEARLEGHLGKEIPFKMLPNDVKSFIKKISIKK
jgi:hypothetical protein